MQWTENAVAVVSLSRSTMLRRSSGSSRWLVSGRHPVRRPTRAIYVANIKGIGLHQTASSPVSRLKYNSHLYFGTLSLVGVPDARELSRLTQTALLNLRYGLMQEARLPARPGQPDRPVPERVGEPSFFKHVVYIIQENRTYDQVLGDLPQGNGDPSLCVFGENITPNHHKLARDFVLLDNTYCSGILSADGHQWTDSAMATDYMERAFAGFPRSYPYGMSDGGVDALAYSPAGFIWDNVLAHGKTLRDYGEWMLSNARLVRSQAQGQDHLAGLLAGFPDQCSCHSDSEQGGHCHAPPIQQHQHGRLGPEGPGCGPGRGVHSRTPAVRSQR